MAGIEDDGQKELTLFNEKTVCSNCGVTVGWRQCRDAPNFNRWEKMNLDGEPHFQTCAYAVALREARKKKL